MTLAAHRHTIRVESVPRHEKASHRRGDAALVSRTHVTQKEVVMPRNTGDRYVCEKCGATLIYEKPCPCPESMPHSEVCCGQQMKLVPKQS